MGAGAVSDREAITAALDRFDVAQAELAALSFDALTGPEVLTVKDRLQTVERRQAAVDHRLTQQLTSQASPVELGAKSWTDVLSNRLRIGREAARRRLDEADDLGPRTAMTGEVLAPLLPDTAAAQAAGQIGDEHVRIIRRFFTDLPNAVDFETRQACETDLARIASEHTPDGLRKAADRLMALVHPDGDFSDVDRARRRGLTIGKQQADGMTEINGLLDPETRATFEEVFAKWAGPGMCNPDDDAPCVDGSPSEAHIQNDQRSPSQRNHDALKAGCEKWHCSAHLRPGGAAAQITWACSTYGAWSAPSSCPTSCRRPVRTWQCPRSSGVGPFCRRDRSIHRLRARILRQR